MSRLTQIEKLKQAIPKSPELWTEEDISKWLDFIKMSEYNQKFQNMKIDGYIILELEESDLEQELGITLRLHRKRIMKGLEILKDYQRYLIEQNQGGPAHNVRGTQLMLEANEQEEQAHHFTMQDKPKQKQPPQHKSSIFITLKQIEGQSKTEHNVYTDGSKIGRHSSNDIIIYDESVSRYHAEIFYNPDQQKFLLKDVSSTTGTYLKLQDISELKEEFIIEIGNYQFEVVTVYVHKADTRKEIQEKSFVEIVIYESPEELDYSQIYKLKHNYTIGRKNTNNISFEDDLHMSNQHCKIFIENDRFYFEDLNSTNGSWLRLSKEGEESEAIVLADDQVFKIGNSCMYQTQIKGVMLQENQTWKEAETSSKVKCTICWENKRNCLVQPCHHNVCCIRCIKNIKTCPICRRPIQDFIKIYDN